ncbi:MAG: DUF1553 domain-containing protein, partial [Planctomycetaceae bacterium]|nr:DUF1553 domain-containing protein [Planctomycetaceae bacterium]
QQADSSRHRSVYLPLMRGLTPRALEPFDPVDQTLVSGNRETTTVPSQALFMLNSSFVRRQSLLLAEQLLTQREQTLDQRVREMYQRVLSRVPQVTEIERIAAFVKDYEAAYDAAQESNSSAATRPTGNKPGEDAIRPESSHAAAWLAVVQSLYASAEFRYLK